MKVRFLGFAALLVAVLAGAAGGLAPRPAAAQVGDLAPYGVASETYYRLNTAEGTIAVRVHAEFVNQESEPLPTLPVWVLPHAANVEVKAGDTVLKHTLEEGSEALGLAAYADATLPEPLKPGLRITLDATYTLPATTGELMHLEPGIIESPFVGQGPGSFVFIDLPKDGEAVLDPGCLVAADQPGEVTDAGLERWICGDALLIALNLDDEDTLHRCAAQDDRCRQRVEMAVFSAYALSVTDESKRGILQADVPMSDGRTVSVTLKYFKRDQAWADRQFDIAKRAFPLLEDAFGFKYPFESVTMLESHHIGAIGAAGVAFSKTGEVLLANETGGVDDEVTIHELAHQWAGNTQLSKPFLWEGLAEWGTRVVAPQLGVSLRDWGWESFGLSLPLSTWGSSLGQGDPDYWYGRAGAFWFAFEQAIGGRANMTTVLGRVDDEPGRWRLEEGWFMDQAEFLTGANLDSLFLDWVFVPESAKPLLAERRAANDLVKALRERAQTAGLGDGMPSDIYQNLLAWAFPPVAGQVKDADEVLAAYEAVKADAAKAGLGLPSLAAESWGTKPLAHTAGIVEDQRQAILSIVNSTAELADEPQGSPYRAALAEARARYEAGDFTGARAAASGGVTSAYNDVAATKMIDLAKEKQSGFSAGFFGTIGLMGKDPDGDLARAEEALAAGDGTLALKLSRGAFDTWDDASEDGIQRLSILTAVTCALCVGVWWVLSRMDRQPRPARAGQGHHIDPSESRSSWRDWENLP